MRATHSHTLILVPARWTLSLCDVNRRTNYTPSTTLYAAVGVSITLGVGQLGWCIRIRALCFAVAAARIPFTLWLKRTRRVQCALSGAFMHLRGCGGMETRCSAVVGLGFSRPLAERGLNIRREQLLDHVLCLKCEFAEHHLIRVTIFANLY